MGFFNLSKCTIILCVTFILSSVGLAQNLDSDDLLSMSIAELMNVEIITAGRKMEQVRDIPASIVVVTREDIETYGYTTLAEILTDIPGIFLIDDYEINSPSLGIRGFWSTVSNRNLILLLNGMNLIDDFHSGYLFHQIPVPVESIERIEVVRGPLSIHYGSGALLGIINIITHEFSGETGQGLVSATGGMGGMQKGIYRLAEGNEEESFRFAFDASYLHSDGEDFSYRRLRREPFDAYIGLDLNDRTRKQLENREIYFGFSGRWKALRLDMTYVNTRNEGMFLFPPPPASDGTVNRFAGFYASLRYEMRLSSRALLRIRGGFKQNGSWAEYSYFHPDFFGKERIESVSTDLEADFHYQVSRRLDLFSGLSYRSALYIDDFYDLPSFGSPELENSQEFLDGDPLVTIAAFTQFRYQPGDALTFIGGIRLERQFGYHLGKEWTVIDETGIVSDQKSFFYEDEEVAVIPRAAVIWSPANRHVFKGMYGEALNRPSFFQNMKNKQEFEDVTLYPERVTTVEFNYLGQLHPRWSVGLSLYRNTLDDLITRVTEITSQGDYRSWNGNAGRLLTRGLELTIHTEPFQALRLEMSATYQKTTDQVSGRQVPYSPAWLAYGKVRFRMAPGLILAFSGHFVDGMETYWDETKLNSQGKPGARIGDSVPGHLLLDGNLRLNHFPGKEWYVAVHCRNLLNSEVRYPTFTSNEWADRGTLGMARALFFTVGRWLGRSGRGPTSF